MLSDDCLRTRLQSPVRRAFSLLRLLYIIKIRAYTQGVFHLLNKYSTLLAELNDEKVANVADSNFDNKNRTLSSAA